MIQNFPFISIAVDGEHVGPFYSFCAFESLWDKQGFLNRRGAEVAWWVKNNGPVYHAYGGTEKNREGSNDYHTFFFEKEQTLIGFREVLNAKGLTDELFANFSDLRFKEPVQVVIVPFQTQSEIVGRTLETWFWIKDNCEGRVWKLGYANGGHASLVFEKADDALLFRTAKC